jgi:lipopolysaccharide transport system ATP-binding protein
MTDAIVVEGLGKRYFRANPKRRRTIHEALSWGFRGMGSTESFWGLRQLSFRAARGTMIGIIGRNGAGKSTLLRLLAGVDTPDEGYVRTEGKVVALLTLGAGFHQDLTGRENVYVSGVVHGLTRAEVRRHFDSIVEFAEVEEFIDSPLRIYSSGMAMRLRFAVAIHTQPDILLIDEVLAVGDHAFSRRCLERIKEFKARGCTIVLTTHSLDDVRNMCEEAFWLDAGRLVGRGEPSSVIEAYLTAGRDDSARQHVAPGAMAR